MMDAADFVRFMRLVKIGPDPGSCWEWIGTRPDNRYGHFTVEAKAVKAHRWIYECVVGPIPEGLLLRHKCDFEACVNPMHLEPGTAKDNIQDCVKRGRKADRRGSKHPLARLTDDDVRSIRNSHECGVPSGHLSSIYGVSRGQIGKIVRRDNWGHI